MVGGRRRRGLRAALTDILGTYRDHADLLRAVVEASTYDEQVGEFWRAVVGRFIEATERRLIDEGEDPSRAAGKAFVARLDDRAGLLSAGGGRRAAWTTRRCIEALLEVWERSVYGPD